MLQSMKPFHRSILSTCICQGSNTCNFSAIPLTLPDQVRADVTLLLAQRTRKSLQLFLVAIIGRSTSDWVLVKVANLKGSTVERYVQGNHAVESSRQWGAKIT